MIDARRHKRKIKKKREKEVRERKKLERESTVIGLQIFNSPEFGNNRCVRILGFSLSFLVSIPISFLFGSTKFRGVVTTNSWFWSWVNFVAVEVQNSVFVVMFTPQRLWSGRSNTPNKSGSGHDLGVISGEGSKGKGVENGGNLDREVLVERVSNLEKEVCFLFFIYF